MAHLDSRREGTDRAESSPAVAFDRAGYALADGRWLVRELTLEVGARETVVLVGRSGAGKTTALKLVNRLLDPTAGEVRVGGRATVGWDPVALRRRPGWVIQEVGLLPHLDVRRNAGLVPELLGWERERIDARVDELLALTSSWRWSGSRPRSSARAGRTSSRADSASVSGWPARSLRILRSSSSTSPSARSIRSPARSSSGSSATWSTGSARPPSS
jgi:hypothetical protein